MYKAVMSLWILAMGISSYSQESLYTGRNSLSGKVIDVKTNSPLAGATVYINDLKSGVASGTDGAYSINNIPAGKHLVEVSFVGYGTHSEYIDIDGAVVKDFSLSPEIVERNEVVVTGVSGATQARRTP